MIPVVAAMYGPGERPTEDLTARARILDAAFAQFAAHGVKGTTMRGIADAAGVSVGLVQHHFGTKDGLRRACDDAVLSLARKKAAHAGPGGELTDAGFLRGLFEELTPLFPYIARMAAEGSLGASSLFDELVTATVDYFTATWPDRFPAGSARTRDAAATLVAMSLGIYVFHEQIARHMMLDTTGGVAAPEFVRRVGVAGLDVYESMGELVLSEQGRQMRRAVDAAFPDTTPPTP